MEACIDENVKEIIFTMWADDGVSFDLDSAIAGVAWCAEKNYNTNLINEDHLSQRCHALKSGDYNTYLTVSKLNSPGRKTSGLHTLWDDPLLGIYWKNQNAVDPASWKTTFDEYTQILEKLRTNANDNSTHFSHLAVVTEFLHKKIELKLNLELAYKKKNVGALEDVKKLAQTMIGMTDKLLASYRSHWYDRYKTFGFEFLHIRLGGQKERYNELCMRLEELLSGKIDSIPELEEISEPGSVPCVFSRLATASYFPPGSNPMQ